jgi:DNA-binding response OmpR family regulator
MARTVLVVEDEPTVRETLAEALTEDGLAVETAEDGAGALEKFRANPPDLILLDLMLPRMSGIEVMRVIRTESQVPILMLTARDSELDKVLGLELGADDYVTKPFSLRELQARVHALLRRSESTSEASVPAKSVDLGDVKVDLAGHQIFKDGAPLAVKPKAFDLLAFLVRNAGQVFSREQLLERVWGYDYAGETRTVDVHVHALRKQIEQDAANPRYIQTVRGVGYVFREPNAAT